MDFNIGGDDLPELMRYALDNSALWDEGIIYDRGKNLCQTVQSTLATMGCNKMAQPLPGRLLWDNRTLAETVEIFKDILQRAGAQYDIYVGEEAIPQFFDGEQLQSAWPITWDLGDNQYAPAVVISAMNQFHQFRGYNPFYLFFIRDQKLLKRPFAQDWIVNADRSQPVLGGYMLTEEELIERVTTAQEQRSYRRRF